MDVGGLPWLEEGVLETGARSPFCKKGVQGLIRQAPVFTAPLTAETLRFGHWCA